MNLWCWNKRVDQLKKGSRFDINGTNIGYALTYTVLLQKCATFALNVILIVRSCLCMPFAKTCCQCCIMITIDILTSFQQTTMRTVSSELPSLTSTSKVTHGILIQILPNNFRWQIGGVTPAANTCRSKAKQMS